MRLMRLGTVTVATSRRRCAWLPKEIIFAVIAPSCAVDAPHDDISHRRGTLALNPNFLTLGSLSPQVCVGNARALGP